MKQKVKFKIGYQLDILLLIALCPLYNAFVGSYGVFQLLTIPLIFLFFIYKAEEREKIAIKSYVWIYIIMLIQDGLLTMFGGAKDVFQELKVHIIVLLVMLHPISFKTTRIIYPFMSLVGVTVGYYMLINQDMVDTIRLSLQIGDVMQDPNWIAIFLFAPFCFGLSLLQKEKIIVKVFGGAIMAFSFYVVFLTGSKGALLGLFAAFLIWVKISFKQSRFTNLALGMATIMLLFLLFTTYFLPNVDTGILERYTSERVMDNERRGIWTDLLKEYLNGNLIDMLVGRGPMSCVKVLGWSAHNIYLEYLFQFGIIGILLMIIFLKKIVKDTIICNNRIGLYILTALIALSLTTPIWGHIYYMTPIAMVIYVNNSIKLSSTLFHKQ